MHRQHLIGKNICPWIQLDTLEGKVGILKLRERISAVDPNDAEHSAVSVMMDIGSKYSGKPFPVQLSVLLS